MFKTVKQQIIFILVFELKLAVIVYLLSVVYEILQMPLYANFGADTRLDKITSALHCALGDLNPFFLGWHIVALWRKELNWLGGKKLANIVALTLIAVAYTTVAEVVYLDIKQLWTYKPLMPRVPLLGIGLTPFIQWMVVVPVAVIILNKAQRVKFKMCCANFA